MANIPGFEAPNLDLRPTEVGIESIAATARRSDAFYNQKAEALSRTGHEVGSAVQDLGNAMDLVITHRQIAQGGLEFSKLIAQSTADWNDASGKADPNDPSVAGKFREEVLEPRLQKFLDSFDTQQGQNWAQNHVNQLRQHFVEKTTADMATNAQIAITSDIEKMRNAWSNTARIDPSSVPFLLSNAESSLDGMVASSPNLKGTAGVKIKAELLQKAQEQIVKAGALGAIEASANPEKAAAEWARRYPTLINGQERDQFGKAARYYNRLNASEDRAERVQRDYENKQDFNNKVNELEARTMPQHAGDPPQLPDDYWDTLRKLSTHPGAALEPGRLAAMASKGEAITARLNKPEPPARASHETTVDLLGKIRRGEMNGNGEIYDNYEKLTNGDFNFLINEYDRIRTPEGQRFGTEKERFFKSVEPSIDKSIFGLPDPESKLKFYEFQLDFERKAAEMRRAGKDPRDLLTKGKPDYMGEPEVLKSYQTPMRQMIGNNGGIGAPAAPATPTQPSNLPTAMTKEQYDKLPRGWFTDKNGARWWKP